MVDSDVGCNAWGGARVPSESVCSLPARGPQRHGTLIPPTSPPLCSSFWSAAAHRPTAGRGAALGIVAGSAREASFSGFADSVVRRSCCVPPSTRPSPAKRERGTLI
jgi:hypothetical protein